MVCPISRGSVMISSHLQIINELFRRVHVKLCVHVPSKFMTLCSTESGNAMLEASNTVCAREVPWIAPQYGNPTTRYVPIGAFLPKPRRTTIVQQKAASESGLAKHRHSRITVLANKKEASACTHAKNPAQYFPSFEVGARQNCVVRRHGAKIVRVRGTNCSARSKKLGILAEVAVCPR